MTLGKLALCTLALAATACGGDSSTSPSDNLTTEQVQSMTSALSLVFGFSLGAPPTGSRVPGRGAAREVAAALPVAGPVACPQGGHVGTNGTFTIDSVGNAFFTLTDTLVDCAVKDNHSNVWTFNSKPTVGITLEELTNIHGDTIDIEHSTNTLSAVGSVQYATGNLTGTCPLDLTVSFEISRGTPTADSATFAMNTSGKVCNRSVTRDTSVTVPYTPPPT